MKVYISGRITGLTFDAVKSKFTAAAHELRAQGHEAVNPLENGVTYHESYEMHMKADIGMLLQCDAVYMLSDWEYSRGATLEKSIAEATGLAVMYQKNGDFCEIKQAIKDITGVSFFEISGRSRKQQYVYARMLFARYCRAVGTSYSDIARAMNRDHSTVKFYLRRFDEDYRFNREFREIAERMRELLGVSKK